MTLTLGLWPKLGHNNENRLRGGQVIIGFKHVPTSVEKCNKINIDICKWIFMLGVGSFRVLSFFKTKFGRQNLIIIKTKKVMKPPKWSSFYYHKPNLVDSIIHQRNKRCGWIWVKFVIILGLFWAWIMQFVGENILIYAHVFMCIDVLLLIVLNVNLILHNDTKNWWHS
jgi:hypothetical protein